MNRERAERIRRILKRGESCVISYDEIEYLCDFYLNNAPKPKIRPEDQPGVPVRIEEAEMRDDIGGSYVYLNPTARWASMGFLGSMVTHVVYIKVTQ